MSDPYFANVVSLFNFSTMADGVSFPDAGSLPQELTAFGGAAVAAGALVLDGDGDYLRQTNDSDFNELFNGVSSTVWTIDLKYKVGSIGSNQRILDWRPGSDNRGLTLGQSDDPTLIDFNIGDAIVGWDASILSTDLVALNDEVELAITRNGSDYLLHINGTYQGSATFSEALDLGPLGYLIGLAEATTNYSTFSLFRLRFTASVARYTASSYTPEVGDSYPVPPPGQVTSTKKLAWSITNPITDDRVTKYHSLSWFVFDAHGQNEINNFTCPVRTHRGLFDDGRTYWIPFYDLSARCSRGPLTNDKFNRYYWTQDGQDMRYAPLKELVLDSYTQGTDVGVPPPTREPLVIPPTATEDDRIVDRAYVYTFVTIYGEEGPPSEATLAEGPDAGTWSIEKMATDTVDDKERNLGSKNIYRSISTGGSAAFHFVATVGLGVTTYKDSIPTSVVGLNHTLESEGWFPPPEGLSGLTAHPNGFFIGYVGRDIYFSEPYRPHAWPVEYVVSTIGDIVGFGIFGSTIVVCTNAHPYTVTGIVPAGMVLAKHDTAEPCVARYGIVSMPFGVYYPGPNGLMLASPRGLQNATKDLMTKEEWQTRYQVRDFDAARYQQQYVAFYNSVEGLMFDPGEPLAALVDLDLSTSRSELDSMESIFTDEYSGRTYILDSCEMYEWNPVAGSPLPYDWTSMEFDIPNPANFGASRIIWHAKYTPPTPEETWAWRIYNTARMEEGALNPLNFHAVNMVKIVPWAMDGSKVLLTYDLTVLDAYPEIDQAAVQAILDAMDATPTQGQIKQPFSWSPMIWVPAIGEDWPDTPFVIMELIINETVVYTKEITHTRMFRLPAGFKGTRVKIRLRSNIHIQSCKLAETGKELAQI